MLKQPGAGELNARVRLQRRGVAPDGFGNMVAGGEFETVTTVWARLLPLRGGEAVLSSRLEGRQPYVLTIRQSSISREIDETWQVVDSRNPERVFSITAPPTDPYVTRAFLDVLLLEGGRS